MSSNEAEDDFGSRQTGSERRELQARIADLEKRLEGKTSAPDPHWLGQLLSACGLESGTTLDVLEYIKTARKEYGCRIEDAVALSTASMLLERQLSEATDRHARALEAVSTALRREQERSNKLGGELDSVRDVIDMAGTDLFTVARAVEMTIAGHEAAQKKAEAEASKLREELLSTGARLLDAKAEAGREWADERVALIAAKYRLSEELLRERARLDTAMEGLRLIVETSNTAAYDGKLAKRAYAAVLEAAAKQPTTPPAGESQAPDDRCEVCDWPLDKNGKGGCKPGDCSYRPREGTEEHYRLQRRREELARPSASEAPAAAPEVKP